MRRADAVHLAAMLAAWGVAYVVPFELLVLAYVVLGPLHYTTEISWLHDRGYFLEHRGALALAAIGLGAALIDNASWFGFAMWSALVIAAFLAAARSAAQGVILLVVALGLTALMYVRWPALAIVGVLLPTVIHVSAFTLIFMGLGAWRARSAAQGWLVVAYLAGIAVILVAPPAAATAMPLYGKIAQDYFHTVPLALGALFGVGEIHLDGRLTAFLAFIYTYHYLNWFIKAEVIRWADIPPARWLLVGAVSAASTSFYFYDYALGFSVLLALSLVHVVLEFPLNTQAARQLAEAIGAGATRLFVPAGTPLRSGGGRSRTRPARRRR